MEYHPCKSVGQIILEIEELNRTQPKEIVIKFRTYS